MPPRDYRAAHRAGSPPPEPVAERSAAPTSIGGETVDVKIEEFPGYLVPVVDDLENKKLVGVVREGDFIAAYREAVHESRAESSDR